MPLPARRHAGKWEPGVAPHTVGRDDFSAAAHLLRISHEEFRGTRACRERVGSPRPGLLTADGEMKFIGQHAKRLDNLGREGWFELPAHERLAIFNAYVRKGLSTAPSRYAGARMTPAAGDGTRRCDWFSAPQSANFFITEAETADLLDAVARKYTADLEALEESARPAR